MSRNISFVDIMEPRRIRGDKFSFMSKYWNPQKAYILNNPCSPHGLKELVANSVYMDFILDSESVKTGIHKEQLKLEILNYLDEIGLDKKVYVIRWLGILFLKISLMMKIKVFVNENAVFQLKKDMGKNPVLFLPTHRSYADFCLLTYLCYHYDIELPAVAAGMDFYSMAILGQRMRETGAFYIRRTLGGSAMYAATLRRYVRTLVSQYNAPVEFFVEGTRSRSNKSLPPKYGMLSMALMPLFSGEVSDITIVPINISYDRLMEQKLFAYEHLGVPKPKESTGGFIKALYSLNDHFGNIYINLGSPLSVREFLKEKPQISRENIKPLDLQQLTMEQFNLVQDVANHVVTLHQQNTVITISNLFALILMERLIKYWPLTTTELVKEVVYMIKVLQRLGASVFENDVKGSLDRVLLIHNKMVVVDRTQRLRLVCDPAVNMSDDVRSNIKGHTLKTNTMMNAVPVIQLQLYVNPVLYYLSPPAILQALVAGGVDKECLEADFIRIRQILKYEFFYSEKHSVSIFETTLKYCLENDVLVQDGDRIVSGSDEKLKYLLKWTIWPAFTILLQCMRVMNECSKCEHKLLLRRVQEKVESARPQCHPYCLSLEAIGNCLQGLVHVGALHRSKLDETHVYTVVADTMNSYYTLVRSVLPCFDVDFGTNNPIIYNQCVNSRL